MVRTLVKMPADSTTRRDFPSTELGNLAQHGRAVPRARSQMSALHLCSRRTARWRDTLNLRRPMRSGFVRFVR